MCERHQGRHFHLLDPLRGFAAISVLVYHVIEINEWQDFPDTWGLGWFRWGWMGVDIFFIISGFVITWSALNILANCDGNRWRATRIFLGRRIRRIVPLYYLSLAIFLLAAPQVLSSEHFGANVATHLIFAHNLFLEFHRSINPPSWTLGTEFQFYLLLILMIPWVRPRQLPSILVGATLLAFLWRTAAFFVNFDATADHGERIFVAVTQLPGMIEFFAFGMAIAFVARSEWFAYIREKAPFRLALLGLVALLGAASMTLFPMYAVDFWRTAYAAIFFRTLLAIWFTALVFFLCCFDPGPRIRKYIAPLTYLGYISYGIYLLHWPVLITVKDLPVAQELKLVLTLGVTVALASLSWHFFESRFLRRH